MYKVIKDKIGIKNDYNGNKTIGFLYKDYIINPESIINNWVKFIYNNKYVWVKLYDENDIYSINISNYDVNNVKSKSTFDIKPTVIKDNI